MKMYFHPLPHEEFFRLRRFLLGLGRELRPFGRAEATKGGASSFPRVATPGFPPFGHAQREPLWAPRRSRGLSPKTCWIGLILESAIICDHENNKTRRLRA